MDLRRLLWLVLFLLTSTITTNACRCIGPVTLENSLENSEVVTTVWIRREVTIDDDDSNRYYQAYVVRVYKGCALRQARRRFRILIRTGKHSCGVSDLQRWSFYVLSGSLEFETAPGGRVSSRRFFRRNREMPILNINLCEYQMRWRDLSWDERGELWEMPWRLDCQDTAAAAAEEQCTLKDCGPQPLGPNFLCPDGETTAGPSGECKYNQETEQCGWGYITCPTCESDRDCDRGEQYCAGGQCRKNGTCRNRRDCFNPSNEYSILKRCLFYVDCTTEGVCDGICGSSCPPGEDPVNCLVNPCDDRITQCDDYHTCVSEYCGGCNAYFFDTKGDPVCE